VTVEQVRNEDLETSADIDEYALQGLEGKELIAYLANAGLGAAGSFSLGFFSETSEQELGGIAAPDVGVPLDQTGTALFTVPAGPLVVRVHGVSNLPSSYSFMVHQNAVEAGTSPQGAP
jgi:hypothetical protein